MDTSLAAKTMLQPFG